MNEIKTKKQIAGFLLSIDDTQEQTLQIIKGMILRLNKLEKQYQKSSENKKELADIEEIKFIGIEFDYGKVKQGEQEANNALEAGFVPLKDVQTNSGMVLILVKRTKEVWDCQKFN